MKRLGVLVILLIITAVGIFIWWKNGIQAVDTTNKSTKIIVIKKGEGIREIASHLKNEDIIRDPIVFFILVKRLGIEEKIQAGDFRLSPSMTANDVAQELTHGTLDVWVTIPEGKRGTEVAAYLKEALPTYEDSWKTVLEHNEGYIFPDTYLVPKDANITTVVNQMKQTFLQKYQELKPGRNSNLSQQEIVTIASMVEREARYKEDQPLVASVILNRLSIDMPLQIDATIQYALGYQEDDNSWWKQGLSAQDLRLDSPYNTYTNTGLPPTPISNPGSSVMQAVIDAPDTDYLYYVSDKNERNHYAKTLSEHNANIQKYLN